MQALTPKSRLIEAIRYGEDPEIRARLQRKVEGVLDTDHLLTVTECARWSTEEHNPCLSYEV